MCARMNELLARSSTNEEELELSTRITNIPVHDLEFFFCIYRLNNLSVNYTSFILLFGCVNQFFVLIKSLFRIHSHTIKNRYLSVKLCDIAF